MADNSDNIKKNKKLLLAALEKSLGVVSAACKKVKLSRQTFYQYCQDDAEFKKQVDEIGEVALDFAESRLFKSIQEGSDTATIFYLKTKGKKRGYIEKQEHDHNIYTGKQVYKMPDGTEIEFG